MQYFKESDVFLLRLEKGEELASSILKFCEENNIRSGFLQAIGATQNLELGFFYPDKKEYTWKTFPQTLEIVSLTGNIALVDDKPFIHMHGVFSSDTFQCFGGHVKSAVVGATCEIYLEPFNTPITRKMNEKIGLKLLDCEA